TGGDHPRPRAAPPDLPAHSRLRSLRAVRQGVHLGAPEPARRRETGPRTQLSVARVLPDVAGLDKAFDYLVPEHLQVRVGTLVRVELHRRRVGGWGVAL